MKRRIASLILAVLLVGAWIIRHNITQQEAILIPDEIHAAGEEVDIGDNYYYGTNENPAGYTVRLEGGKALTKAEFQDTYGVTAEALAKIPSQDMTPSELIYVLELTFTNRSSEKGTIVFSQYVMIDHDIQMWVDEALLPFCQPDLADSRAFRLRKGLSKTILLPFVANPIDVESHGDALYRRMAQGNFQLCLSLFPTRKLIAVKNQL